MLRKLVLVTGAGGFIHHLVSYLVGRGYCVRGVNQMPEYAPSAADEFLQLDLRFHDNCKAAVKGVTEVYHLAADMGGIGYISGSHATITLNNTLINAHMIAAVSQSSVKRFLFSSSACVYPQYLQKTPDVTPLREEDAFPAEPEEGYGLEKLFMERSLTILFRVLGAGYPRFPTSTTSTVPLGTYDGGREKAPAAICRKIAHCEDGDDIEIWGDGQAD